VPRTKGAGDRQKRKRRALPAKNILAVCETHFRTRFGRDFTEADRARLVVALLGPGERGHLDLTTRNPAGIRGGLLFLTIRRDGAAVIVGHAVDSTELVTDHDLAVLSFLLGVASYSPRLDERKDASKLLDAERATFAKQRERLMEIAVPVAKLGIKAAAGIFAAAAAGLESIRAAGAADFAGAARAASAAEQSLEAAIADARFPPRRED
jgi:hypothetical protein